MFSLGGTELIIVVLVALLLFGPDKIPQMARTIGRFTREFNKYKDIMESTVRAEIYKADTEAEAEAPVKDEPVLTPEQRIAKAAAAANEVRAKRAAEVAAAESASKAAETDEEDEEEEE